MTAGPVYTTLTLRQPGIWGAPFVVITLTFPLHLQTLRVYIIRALFLPGGLVGVAGIFRKPKKVSAVARVR